MATIQKIEGEVAAVVAFPTSSMSKKRKTSVNEQTKIELLERRMMGADVASIDLTGLLDDAFDAYRLALVISQFVTGGELTSGSAICIIEVTAPRLVADPSCPVFVYSPTKETDIWSDIVQSRRLKDLQTLGGLPKRD